MPPKMRALLTLVVLSIGMTLWQFREVIGLAASPWLFFGLIAFISGSIWLFPEVRNKTE